MFIRQNGKCQLSRIPFAAEPFFPDAQVPRPWWPSLDRINPRLGYVSSNVRLVVTAANFAKHQWSDAILLDLARGIVDFSEKSRRP
jgi:hypothetical protein